jgi:hypothetical protein
MSGNQGKIHQDQEDKLPSNGEDGDNLLYQDIGTGHEDQEQDHQQVSNYKKTLSNVLGELQARSRRLRGCFITFSAQIPTV